MITKKCKQCGREFTLTDGEIEFFRSKGLDLPARCESCRKANKANKARKDTGVRTSAPVKKGSGRSVYAAAALAVLIIAAAVFKIILPGISGGNDTYLHTSETIAVLHSESVTKQAEETAAAVVPETTAYSEIVTNQAEETAAALVPETTVYSEIVTKQTEETAAAVVPETTVYSEIVTKQTEETAAAVVPETTTYSEIVTKQTEETAAAIVYETTVTAAKESLPVYRFRNAKLLLSHYENHGIEMGFASAEEYEKAASAVVVSPDALHKLEKEDGDDVYYIESTNEFVIVSADGFIRTYFYPEKGKDYFDKQ